MRFLSSRTVYPYSLLPTTSRTGAGLKPRTFLGGVCLTRRYSRTAIAALSTFALFVFYLLSTRGAYPPYPTPLDRPPADDTRPPLYERYTTYERHLPQHDQSLPPPEGKHAKYLFFGNHIWNLGWGNAMQEMILNAHVAYSSGRTFVFDDYVWNIDSEYSDYNGKLIPSRIPLTALVAGPLAGYPYSNTTDIPRSVSWHYYSQICPDPLVLQPSDVRTDNATALQVLEAWVEKLSSIEDRCVEFRWFGDQLFDYMLLGSPRLHDILPSLFASPMVQEFSWSPLIHYTFQRNQRHFMPSTQMQQNPLPLFNYFKRPILTPTPPHPSTLPILALHLRQGDFVEHCDSLYAFGSTYTGYNSMPDLPDRFFAENPKLLESMSKEEIKKTYREKCLVDIDQVRKRVVRAVREWREKQLAVERRNGGGGDVEGRVREKLRRVYIMTNGNREWLKDLKKALEEDVERSSTRTALGNQDRKTTADFDYDFVWSWDEISTSRDLELGWEARYVAPALDMYVGQRAEVFVGNGFSSLTANIVMLRAANGVEPWKTRFW